MIRPIAVAIYVALLLAFIACSTGQRQSSPISTESTSLCQLMLHPDEHLGQLVTLHVRVSIFRHGTSISDAACSQYAVSLVSGVSQSESLSNFDQFVAEHRQSNKPIFATIEGRLARGSNDGFVAKRNFVFRLESAREVHEENTTKAP